MQIEWRAIESLIPYARNARSHSPDQIEQIARSMQTFGWTNPALLDARGVLIAGHGRVLGAKAVIFISVIGQLFCGIACMTSGSRMTFAFSRDGAVPGHRLWRRLNKHRTPTWAVLFVVMEKP